MYISTTVLDIDNSSYLNLSSSSLIISLINNDMGKMCFSLDKFSVFYGSADQVYSSGFYLVPVI